MSYKVYKKEVGSEEVELVNDEVYETQEDAQIALEKARDDYMESQETIPLPGEFFGPGQTTIPVEKIVSEENISSQEQPEFFIRKI